MNTSLTNIINKTIAFPLGFVLMALVSCADFTDIDMKGANLLSSVDELELLLNREYYLKTTDMKTIVNDDLGTMDFIPTILQDPVINTTNILLLYDEKNYDKYAELMVSDECYNNLYGIIGKVCNAILSRIDDVSGNDIKKKQIKCEALIQRAWWHYILVNRYAKTYNPSTAANDGGIVYCKREQIEDVLSPAKQCTVQEVYDNILADIEECIEIDGLPVNNINMMRVNKPFQYAVKAMVLASMQRYDEAKSAAEKALAINSYVGDYYSAEMTQDVVGQVLGEVHPAVFRKRLDCAEDYFYTESDAVFSFLPLEIHQYVEDGNAVIDRFSTDYLMYDNIMGLSGMFIGLDGYLMSFDAMSGWNDFGIKTTYMYVIIAEAELHKGNIKSAMAALDKIRSNRIDPTKYQPLENQVTSQKEAIEYLKKTAHGEGVWTSYYNYLNVKRWNVISGWETNITRQLGDKTFTLPSNSRMWVFPFPVNVVTNNPYINQNY